MSNIINLPLSEISHSSGWAEPGIVFGLDDAEKGHERLSSDNDRNICSTKSYWQSYINISPPVTEMWQTWSRPWKYFQSSRSFRIGHSSVYCQGKSEMGIRICVSIHRASKNTLKDRFSGGQCIQAYMARRGLKADEVRLTQKSFLK